MINTCYVLYSRTIFSTLTIMRTVLYFIAKKKDNIDHLIRPELCQNLQPFFWTHQNLSVSIILIVIFPCNKYIHKAKAKNTTT